MKKRLIIGILLFLASNASLSNEKSKFKIELDFNNSVSFGVDELQNLTPYLKPLIKTLKPREAVDFVVKEDGNQPPDTGGEVDPPTPSDPKTYTPNISATQRDFELATRYLSKNIRYQKGLNVKVSSDYLGLSAYVNAKDTNYSSDKVLAYDKLKIGASFNKPYLYVDVHSYILGESSKKYGIEQVDMEEELENKEVKYDIALNPLYNKMVNPILTVSGVSDYATISPSIKVNINNDLYIKAGPSFRINNDKHKVDVVNEIQDLKYTAPGYSKIEYFKKWTLKENVPADITFENDKIDYEKAEVSSYKGTSRFLGLESGSLYGDLPVKLIMREVYNVSNLDKYTKFKQVLDKIQKEDAIGILGMYTFGSLKELETKYPLFLKDVTDNVYDRMGIKYKENTSSLNLINVIPDEFAKIAMLKDYGFDISNYNEQKLSPDYLYHGIDKAVIKQNTERTANRQVLAKDAAEAKAADKKEYVLSDGKKIFDFEKDLNNYVIEPFKNSEIYKNIDFNNNIVSNILSIVSGKIFDNFKEILNEPYKLEYVDLLRGIYFHNSEKGKNEYSLGKKIEKVLDGVENQSATKMNNTMLDFELGYAKNGYNVVFNTRLNDGFRIKNDKYEFKKDINRFSLYFSKNHLIDEKNRIFFDSKLGLDISKNYFKKDENNIFKYNKYDLSMLNRFMYNRVLNDALELQLGLNHIGQFGIITNPYILIDGEEYKENVAIRDKNNNPKTHNGEFINVSEHTEYELTKKALELEENKGKVEREVSASDYIAKKEEKAQNVSLYKAYNIVIPNVSLVKKISDNLIITNKVEVPIAFVGTKFSGINPTYSSNIKYIVNDKDILNAIDINNIYKFTYHGDINVNYDKDKFLEYDLLLDTKVAKLNLDGTLKNIDFELNVNPLIIDMGVRPELAIEKKDDFYNLKFGINSDFKNNRVALGLQKAIYTSKDFYKENIKNVTLEVLKDRNANEYNTMKPLLENLSIDKKDINYDFKPYIQVKSDLSKLKYDFKASSFAANYKELRRDINVIQNDDDFSVKNPSSIRLGNNYIYWLYQKYDGKYIYVYQLDESKEKITEKSEQEKSVNVNKYTASLDLAYENEEGFNFKSSTNFDKEETNIKVVKQKELEIESSKRKAAYTLHASGSSIIENEHFKRMNSPQDLIDKANEKGYNFYCKYNFWGTCSNYDSKDKVRANEKLFPTKPITENKTEVSERKLVTDLTTNVMDFSTKNEFSYNFKDKKHDKLTYIVGADSDVEVKVLEIKKFMLDGNVLFGSRKVDVKNILTPNIGIKYNVFENANINLKLGVPVKFIYHNNKEKLNPFELKINFNYKF